MKKFVLVLVCSFFALSAWSLNYCQTSAWGYGAAATGGGNATPTLVKSYSELKSAMGSSNKVIIITQNIAFSSVISCSKSNLTIMALPGVKLTAQSKNIGFFSFNGCSNIIIRNIFFEGKGSDTQQKGDAMTFDGVTKGWVDHCTFQDGSDGNFDIVGLSDNITVSWCRFRYTLGGEHCFSNLIASNSEQKPTDGTYNITFAYCWWDAGCQQRMVRSRNASIHYLNSYWNSSDASYYIGLENTDVYVEGCYFEGAPAKSKVIWANWGGTNGAIIKDSYSKNGFPSIKGRTVTVPSYTYSAVDYTTARNMVTNTTCGAGPTLQVTTAGAVSSTCDGDNPTLNDPTNKSQTVTAGTAISSITFTATNATNISVTGLPAGLTSSTNGLTLTISGAPTASGTYTVTATNASGGSATAQGTITVSTTPGPGPTPALDLDTIKTTTLWNFSTSDFSGLGTLTADQKANGLLIAADESATIIVEANKKSIDGYSFTSRIKTGGAMTSTARFFAFCVTGNCTIEIYCMSSSGNDARTMNVAIGTWDNTKQTLDVGTTIDKHTYSYTGTATSIYIGSNAGGINFYAIKVIYPTTPTALDEAAAPALPSKILRNGQILILHHGHYYNLQGLRVGD